MSQITVVGNSNLKTALGVEAFPLPYRPTTVAPFAIRTHAAREGLLSLIVNVLSGGPTESARICGQFTRSQKELAYVPAECPPWP